MIRTDGIEIDWIEIPKGKFMIGLSDEQRAYIKDRLRVESEIDKLDEETRGQVEGLLKKELHTPHVEYLTMLDNLTPEENEILYSERFSNFFRAEKRLSRLPSSQQVHLDTFYIARFPITKRQARVFYNSPFAHRFRLHKLRILRREDVVNMPEDFYWSVADAFAHWLGGRLPSVYEWEKAARGTDGRLYPSGNKWNPKLGNFGPRFSPRPDRPRERGKLRTVVNAYPDGASPYGVEDMFGNSSEWTTTLIPVSFPWLHEPSIKGYNVKHGGEPAWFWSILAHQERGSFKTGVPLWNIGFRPVLDEWQRQNWPGFSVKVEE